MKRPSSVWMLVRIGAFATVLTTLFICLGASNPKRFGEGSTAFGGLALLWWVGVALLLAALAWGVLAIVFSLRRGKPSRLQKPNGNET